MPNALEIFTKKLRNAIDSGVISKADIARRTGLSPTVVGHYYDGTSPGLEAAEKCAQALGYTLSDFLAVDKEYSDEELLRQIAGLVAELDRRHRTRKSS